MAFNTRSYNHSSFNVGRLSHDQLLISLFGPPRPGVYPGRFIERSPRIENRVELTSREKQIQNLLRLHNTDTDTDIEVRDTQSTQEYLDDYVTITINLSNQITRYNAVIPGYEEDIELNVLDINIIDDGTEININNLKVEKLNASL